MKEKHTVEIIENKKIAMNTFKMIILAPLVASEAKAGQFLNVFCKRGDLLLPRPISICELDIKSGTITLVYAVVGKGTAEFAKMLNGEQIDIMGPLGNGFCIDETNVNHLIIGGGIGVAPLLELVKSLKGNKTVYLGFNTEPYLIDEFNRYADEIRIAVENKIETGDGSFETGDGSLSESKDGTKNRPLSIQGNVMDLVKKNMPKADMIYACGPKPMLEAINGWAEEKEIEAQFSMEERMACGIGACLVCTCKIKKDEDREWQNYRVCKDGPIFYRDEVIWE
ncbi:MAG: dihydroorotate dehydrogenase electron transfer subunit [Alkaliphilus sp.]